ncbi:MAG: T9SS type A sorting domain-containing protein [Bacteroidetes bacterium]|nr:T9SS type A sorting domain-containing protein [Bacteroidota bacterium]
MKNLIKILLLFCVVNGFAQQNLVPNHSFEIIDTCPTTSYIDSPSNFAKDWFDIRNTPDYYTQCSSINLNYKTPETSGGYQCPANGLSYLGLVTLNSINPSANEMAATKLTDSLVKNKKYFMSFKMVHSGGIGVYYATSKMGLKFFTKKPDNLNPAFSAPDKYVTNNAHLYTNLIINDTLNWTTIKGSFIADSNYKYVAIGSFFSYANQDTTKVFTGSGFKLAYYFIDDICVSLDSNVCNIPIQAPCFGSTSINNDKTENNLFKVYPNPSSDYIYVENKTSSDVVNFKIYDLFGNAILEYNANEIINIKNLNKGVYYIKTTYKNREMVIEKIIKN